MPHLVDLTITVDAEQVREALGRVAAAEPGRVRVWVSDDRRTLVRLWASGEMELAWREGPSHTWGPPIVLHEERA